MAQVSATSSNPSAVMMNYLKEKKAQAMQAPPKKLPEPVRVTISADGRQIAQAAKNRK